MLGKTHMAIGVAAAMAAVQPESLPELVAGLSAAAVGAVISDIDVGTAEAHRDADIVTMLAVAAVGAAALAEKMFHIGIVQRIMENSSTARIALGCVVFLVVCAVGKQSPHRSMMHSVLILGVLTACVHVAVPMAAPYFAVAFASHLFTDIFNYKAVRLLYPLPGGLCLRLFHATGAANALLFPVGCVAALMMTVRALIGIL